MIVGAPIIAAGTTSASSGTSSGSTTVIGPCSSIACRASNVPTYGLPPPPVPRMAAPNARSSSCSERNSRTVEPLELQVADRLHLDSCGVAGHVRQRHVLNVDDSYGRGSRARRDGLVDRLGLRLVERRVARQLRRARTLARPRRRPGRSPRQWRSRQQSDLVESDERRPEASRRVERCRLRLRRPGSGRGWSSSCQLPPRASVPRQRDLAGRGRHRGPRLPQDPRTMPVRRRLRDRWRSAFLRRKRAPATSTRTRRCPDRSSARHRGRVSHRRGRVRGRPAYGSSCALHRCRPTTDASRGKPCCSTPTSEVVPPMSTTAQSSRPERNAAPRIEFVGPEANVATG